MNITNDDSRFVPHSMHIAYTLDGLGTYSAEAISYSKTIAQAIPLLQEAIKQIHVPPGSIFTIADYGAADAGTSMPFMYQSVKIIREKYGEDMPITVIYEDQPVNDFKSVFMRLQGIIPGPHRSYLSDFSNVFTLASGTNFYSQCFPSSTVHIGFSATCIHWLREKPCDVKNEIHIINSNDMEELEMFSKQKEKDWELFLFHRAEELSPGGYLILAQLAIDKYGQSSGNVHGTKYSIFDIMCKLWKDFAHEGKITKEEFVHTTFTAAFRTEEEFKKPFDDPESSVSRKGLELMSIEVKVIPCAHKERWLTEKGNSTKHAKRFIESLRIWTYSTLFSGLSDNRSSEERAQIMNEFYERYESLVAKDPDDHGGDFVTAFILIRKKYKENKSSA